MKNILQTINCIENEFFGLNICHLQLEMVLFRWFLCTPALIDPISTSAALEAKVI